MPAKMVAVGYAASLPISDDRSLFEFETPVPRPEGRDLLVSVKAVSVNPVDVKVRMRKQGTESNPVILGWDAAGIVEAAGSGCEIFRPGDRVYYAGNVNRPGSDAPSIWSTSASSAARRNRSASPRLPPCRSRR